MGLIKYDEKNLLDAKNRIDICNEQIINALEIIDREFNDMNTTLDTPKSRQAISLFLDYYKETLDYMRNSKESINTLFDTISNNYNEYYNTISEMVGDKSGNYFSTKGTTKTIN